MEEHKSNLTVRDNQQLMQPQPQLPLQETTIIVEERKDVTTENEASLQNDYQTAPKHKKPRKSSSQAPRDSEGKL